VLLQTSVKLRAVTARRSDGPENCSREWVLALLRIHAGCMMMGGAIYLSG